MRTLIQKATKTSTEELQVSRAQVEETGNRQIPLWELQDNLAGSHVTG